MSQRKGILFSLAILLLSAFFVAPLVYSQELVQDKTEIVKARVIDVLSESTEDIVNTGIESLNQTIKVEILEGEQKGLEVTLENDYVSLEEGDTFFLYHSIDGIDGREIYSVRDVNRIPVILFFIALFIGVAL
jgi:uncharacterized membrane protein